jgi:hypothetical protein
MRMVLKLSLRFASWPRSITPDLHAGDKLAERRFQTINGVLSKPNARAAYDAVRALQRVWACTRRAGCALRASSNEA